MFWVYIILVLAIVVFIFCALSDFSDLCHRANRNPIGLECYSDSCLEHEIKKREFEKNKHIATNFITDNLHNLRRSVGAWNNLADNGIGVTQLGSDIRFLKDSVKDLRSRMLDIEEIIMEEEE